jgi:hypothetical protein
LASSESFCFKKSKIRTMGLFWNLIQQSQISDQKGRAETLEARVAYLEYELQKTKSLLINTLKILEEQSGKDIDGDGKIG